MTKRLNCEICGCFMKEIHSVLWRCTHCGAEFDVGWSGPR
jgi:ribosomal protein L37AE/L43A